MRAKDPLIALLFTFVFPGLGHVYLGMALAGGVLMIMHFLFLGAAVAFMVHPTMGTNRWFLAPVLVFVAFEVWVVIDVYLRALRSGPRRQRTGAARVLVPLAVAFVMFVFNGNVLTALAVKRHIALVPRVRSDSMAPRLITGDWFLIDKTAYRQRPPGPGDVVFFDSPVDERVVVKRIAAVGGETVEIKDGDLYVNGVYRLIPGAAGNVYANAGEFGAAGRPVTVPPGHCFVLGDHTATSIDSRYWGFLPAANITGKAHKIIYPFDRSGPVY